MKVRPLGLPGLVLCEPDIFEDPRGRFLELWNEGRYGQHGVEGPFVQDNLSWSAKGVLRGLHYQWRRPQGKLVSVVRGDVLNVAVDVRPAADTFGQSVAVSLTAQKAHQLYVPEGFANGFLALSNDALVMYKCTQAYDPAAEVTVLWRDPELAIDWPVTEPLLSAKDRAGLLLRDVPRDRLPRVATHPRGS